MHDQGRIAEMNQDVFRAAGDPTDDAIPCGGLEDGVDRPAQAALADQNPGDSPADEAGRDPPSGRLDFRELGQALLDLGFFVSDVLAHDRVELLDLHLIRVEALVLGRGVVMPRARGGYQLDFVAH
jgi:hypothetical protein